MYSLFFAAALASLQTPPTPAERQRAAVDQQRAAIRKQAEAAGVRMTPWAETPVEPGPTFDSANPECAALAESVVTPLIDTSAKEQGVDSKLLRAVMEQESGFHPCAVSAKGAQGLMQLMPSTAEELQLSDPFDPKQNIDAGAKYLKQLLEKYDGDISQALGAYNAGPNIGDPAAKIPETKAYVDAILSKMGIKRTDPPSIQTPKPIEN